MLTLEAPSLVVDGIPIFRDDRDALTLYYVNTVPRISRLSREHEDGAVTVLPYLQLLKYRELAGGEGEDLVGGLLFGDVDLGVEDDWLTKAAQVARTQLGLAATPRLRPPDWESGSVRFMVLGAVSEEASDPDAEPSSAIVQPVEIDGSHFVKSFVASSTPSLMGDNRAIFQVELDHRGVAMFEESIELGTTLPIGVVYDLTMLAKRPAYRVSIVADWSQVLHLVDEKFKANAIFVSVSIENFTQELIDEKVIEIVTEVDDPQAADAATKATEELKTLVLERFFEPALSPAKASEKSIPDQIVDFYAGMKAVALGNVGYSRRQVDASMTQSWNVSQSLVTAVQRRVAPQAHLATLVEGADLTLEQIVRQVDLDDDEFFRLVNLEVRALVPWAAHRIASVVATVRYGSEVDTFEFLAPSEPAATAAATFRRFVEPGLGTTFDYDWTVRFVDDAAGPHRIDSGPRTVQGNILQLDDNELYTWRSLTTTVDAGVWHDFDLIELHAGVTGSDEPGHQHISILRADDAHPADPRWAVVIPGAVPPQLDWTAIYRSADRDPILVHGDPSTSWALSLGNPLKAELSILFSADDPFLELGSILLEVTADDPTGRADIERVLFVRDPSTTKAPASITKLDFDDIFLFERKVAEPTALDYHWRQTLVPASGPRIHTRWRRSRATDVALGMVSAHEWPIAIRLEGDSFVSLGLGRIVVRLWLDGVDGPAQTTVHTFTSTTDQATWIAQLRDPAVTTYRHETTYEDTFGRRRTTAAVASGGADLVIPTIRI